LGDVRSAPAPPYRVETERLVIRCWHPRDATLLKEAIDSSIDHLRPWMPWAAHEPQSLAEKTELLRRFRGLFDLGQDFPYGIFTADESAVVGGTGLHTRRGDDAFEIGYWIRASRVREGLATETVTALTRVGFEHGGADRIEIHVDPANEASCGIPPKVGYAREAMLRRRLAPGIGESARRDEIVFTLFADELAGSPAARARVAAWDAAGVPLPMAAAVSSDP
jgi:RimJ/RimL family protein N-acetyltransferase